MKKEFRCLMCGLVVYENSIDLHKRSVHAAIKHYGLMWPHKCEYVADRDLWPTSFHVSEVIAKALGVRKVYIKDEGMNFSGSMKDYSVERMVRIGCEAGYKVFFIVSSGNHAVSLAKYAVKNGVKAVVFTPATSSKIGLLSSMENVYVVGVRDAIFEDVYSLVAGMDLEGFYNANVSNEFSLAGFTTIAEQVACLLEPLPTHILAGVGNGSYLAGILLGLECLNIPLPKIIPVGMSGAFPVEAAFAEREYIAEYDDFKVDEHAIDAAEGSIAIASYSMPQLMHAMYLSQGFPLGNILNEDLGTAYELLVRDDNLIEKGIVPEPTGIMGLAAAIKHRERFSKDDVVLISFTGHGVKDMEGIQKVAPAQAALLLKKAVAKRPDLRVEEHEIRRDRIIIVDKTISAGDLKLLIEKIIGGDGT